MTHLSIPKTEHLVSENDSHVSPNQVIIANLKSNAVGLQVGCVRWNESHTLIKATLKDSVRGRNSLIKSPITKLNLTTHSTTTFES